MLNDGVGSWPARRARKTPDRVAVVHEGGSLTYRELDGRVSRLAGALRELGVARRDRVAYLGPNHPAFLETLFAVGVVGAVFVPLNTRLAAAELAYVLADSGSSVLVHAPELADSARSAAEQAAERAGIATHLVPLPYDDVLATCGPGGARDEPVSLDDICMIMYTSGTTGRPKGAVLTHGNVVWNSLNVLVDVDLAGDEVTLVVAPLFHTAGLNMTCLPTLLKGGRVVLLAGFDADQVLDTIKRHRVTCMFAVPTMYDALRASPRWERSDLSSLRTMNCGGAPVPLATIQAYLDRGLAFSQGYGMTEASPGVLYLHRDDAATKTGSAGVPHFFTDVRLDGVASTSGSGERGEIMVSGPNVAAGYWNQPAATAAAFQHGWFRSGDVGELDDDGYVRVVDRVKDMIISGGENIYPAEVEAVLTQHPAVADCAVIGVPDEKWGEVGRAVVVRAPESASVDEAELLAFLDGRLARYKIPKTVVLADAIPRNATGKILKPLLRQRFG
jgi:fatty-acyl-CoA synthase